MKEKPIRPVKSKRKEEAIHQQFFDITMALNVLQSGISDRLDG
jgi:hypothetical protein